MGKVEEDRVGILQRVRLVVNMVNARETITTTKKKEILSVQKLHVFVYYFNMKVCCSASY